MKARASAILLICGCGVLLAGCEETARRTVRVRVPEMQVAPNDSVGALPLDFRYARVPHLTVPPTPEVDLLVERVEAAYRSGEENFKAGNVEKARQDFDRAVDWLLDSGIPLESDARLHSLFERIIDTVHAYELAASRQENGAIEQRTEQAPIDEIADLTYPVDPSLKERIERDLQALPHDLPITVNDQVLSYVNFFQTPRGRAIVEAGLRRAGRYQEMISRVLREEGMPQDLIFLAQAESGFKPLALSRAGARGIWQFMASRGREYGLHRNWWLDQRQDPELATRAAARHLRDLYEMFGDWYLAMAAYNTGPGNVTRAIERTGYADFWELHKRSVLPKQTKNYVPIILALSIIAKNAQHYGIHVDPEAALHVDRVKPEHPVNLRLAAEAAEISLDDLKALNPQLLRMVTPKDPEFELSLPEGTAERFLAELAEIPVEKWPSWQRHRVEEGETLATIARKYRLTAKAIAATNGLDADAELRAGDRLTIPANAAGATGLGRLVHYRVRRGDSLLSIAEQFNVTLAELRSWNHIAGDRPSRGTTLKIYPGGRPERTAAKNRKTARPAPRAELETTGEARLTDVAQRTPPAPAPSARGTVHRVQAGDTLWSIARTYQTTVEALRRANRFLAARAIHPGDQLLIEP